MSGAEWCWWDLWFCVLAAADFGGELGRLEADLVGRLCPPVSVLGLFRGDVEGKLSHLADLRARLSVAGIAAADLVAAGKGAGVLPRARTKILKNAATGSSMTAAMVETPRVRLERRARWAHWESFPVDPAPFYAKFRRSVEGRDTLGERRTVTLSGQLWERLCRLAKSCRTPAQELALHRAFHTAGLELADRADDSFGSLGDLRVEAFEAYVNVDWAAAGISGQAYWQDLCELLVWEPYALTVHRPTLPFLHAKGSHAELIESVLLGLAEEHRVAHLDRKADEALALVAWLHIAARRYRRYPATAERLGSESAGPILALAESALRGHRPDIAGEVFRVADRPGRDQERLRGRCRELTGVRLDDQSSALNVEQGGLL